MTQPRLVVLGDEYVTGVGDPKQLGWLGRIRSQIGEKRVVCYELAWPQETTAGLLKRWQTEALPRFEGSDANYLMIALGASDIEAEISISRSRLNLASVLDDAARQGVKTFVVGPLANQNSRADDELAALNAGFADVTKRRGLVYVDCFLPIIEHRGHFEIDAEWPGQAAYAAVAKLILAQNWLGWIGN